MPADMELQIVASLLRRGRSLDQLSTGLTLVGVLFGLAQLLMASVSPICLLLSLWMIILGLLQKYWALRVAFDADLFALLARDTERTADLDQALQSLGLQSAKRAGRPWAERRRGAGRKEGSAMHGSAPRLGGTQRVGGCLKGVSNAVGAATQQDARHARVID